MIERFRFAKSERDPTGLDILDPDGNRVAWGHGEYAAVALRAINRYIDGDDAPEFDEPLGEPATHEELAASFRERISHAEFSRFVQEAGEQRARAAALEVENAAVLEAADQMADVVRDLADQRGVTWPSGSAALERWSALRRRMAGE